MVAEQKTIQTITQAAKSGIMAAEEAEDAVNAT